MTDHDFLTARRKRRLRRQAGVSLVSVIVAVGIAGILAMIMSRLHHNSIVSQQRVTQDADLNAIRTMLTQRVDCKKTLVTSPTACSGAVALKDKLGGTIVGAAGGAIGKWTINATCNTANGEISVQGTRPNPSGGYYKDPLNGLPQDASNAHNSLFPPKAGLCSSYFGAATFSGCVAPSYIIPAGNLCTLGDTMTGFDPSSNQACCSKALPACASGQMAVMGASGWTCGPSCATGQMAVMGSSGWGCVKAPPSACASGEFAMADGAGGYTCTALVGRTYLVPKTSPADPCGGSYPCGYQLDAPCVAGDSVLGGGGRCGAGDALSSSRPGQYSAVDRTGWHIYCAFAAVPASPAQAFALCMKQP